MLPSWKVARAPWARHGLSSAIHSQIRRPQPCEECPYAHDRDEKRKYRGKHVVSVAAWQQVSRPSALKTSWARRPVRIDFYVFRHKDQTAELYISDTSDVLAESIRTEQPDSSVAAGSNFTDVSCSEPFLCVLRLSNCADRISCLIIPTNMT